MTDPIVITPQEIINIVLAICGAIITISGAGTVIIRAIAKAREPNHHQNERLDKVEGDIRDIKAQLRENIHQFSLDEMRVDDLEKDQKEINILILESLKAIMDHDIDGNNIEILRESNQKVDRYLINKAS